MRFMIRALLNLSVLALVVGLAASVRAQQDMPGVVMELRFTPAPRVQLAVWLEDHDGHLVRTLALTEAVAYRGIGNRPGASEMNSGYRWPYGRREGGLPIWASRRAAAPGAKLWKRVIFQDRTAEGLASRTSSDQSTDNYYCLSFAASTTKRDALDAVSCASVFSSDKGRFLTATDVAAGYHEPWLDPVSGVSSLKPLPLHAVYPPRMDVAYCQGMSGTCYDHADIDAYASHAREVMPEIDAVTTATPPGNAGQSLLFSLPTDWPTGSYSLWVEVNVEGDYNASFDDKSYPTPTGPGNEWDSWALTFGYPYRGQPSIAFRIPFTLDAVGETMQSASVPEGRSSWNVWDADYGKLQKATDITDDPSKAPGSGADRLRRASDGTRLTLDVQTLVDLPGSDPNIPLPPVVVGRPDLRDAGSAGQVAPSMHELDAGVDAAAQDAGVIASPPDPATQDTPGTPVQDGDAVILVTQAHGIDGPVGAIHNLLVSRHSNLLHSHEWVSMGFLAPTSEQPLHRYEVRVATLPIVDEVTFIQNGKPAKTATTDAEGAVSLTLPVDAKPGTRVTGDIGDLVAQTHYYVAVRARDRWNRYGPISVAQVDTTKRTFATVTPCFVATAAFGTPMAREVAVLRRLRDRQLLTNAPGRAFVKAYYERGAELAERMREHEALRSLARALLRPLVALVRYLDDGA